MIQIQGTSEKVGQAEASEKLAATRGPPWVFCAFFCSSRTTCRIR